MEQVRAALPLDGLWRRWGTYLPERQWGTVREDYSEKGEAWTSFSHDDARSRAYRWGEDGLLGWTDRQCRLCFGIALWNHRDPILKERLFGLSGPQGNHGEDVKECYYYLDATPTHSYAKALYKYPQAAFPYDRLIAENRKAGRGAREFDLEDTGVFDEDRYFDVFVEYAKAGPNDTRIRVSIANRGPEKAALDLLPSLWFRNTWSWGSLHEDGSAKPVMWKTAANTVRCEHETLGVVEWTVAQAPAEWLFTENETNSERLFKHANAQPYVKDAFHRWLIDGDKSAVNPQLRGTKAAAVYHFEIPAGETVTWEGRLSEAGADGEIGSDLVFEERQREGQAFYASAIPEKATSDQTLISRQAYAGLIWTKQFYYYVVRDWLSGDADQPTPPDARKRGRNSEWRHLHAREILSMPDKWEYPWFAAWDLAFHMIPFARIDPLFAKQQLIVLLREWYMHPNGQLPAYEWEFCDVNPPVHAWAVWRVYKITGERGARDRAFLESAFQKLLLNFTWWVNRKDSEGNNLFSGGFLGLDNIGVFDRSRPLPGGGALQQADGTAWMGFYCLTMLAMALELARESVAYEDMASKFFEHFIGITEALNHFDGMGLWDEEDGFYYDHLQLEGQRHVLKSRSMVGLIPLLAVELLEDADVAKLEGFEHRMKWFIKNRPESSRLITRCDHCSVQTRSLLALPAKARLERVVRRLLDESEFLSPQGIRSLSAAHGREPFVFHAGGEEHSISYSPGDSPSGMFGGNSNWRGPVWFPINYLLIEALEKYGHFYGRDLMVECPSGSGQMMTLGEVACFLSRRLVSLFERDETGRRPCFGPEKRHINDPHWKDLILFHEFFHGDNGRGLGASHQTGWTALVTRCIEDLAAEAESKRAAI